MQPEVFRCHCKLGDLFTFQGLRVSRPKTAGQQVHHADVRGQPQPVQTPPGPRHHRGPADEGSGPGREAAEEDGEVCWETTPALRPGFPPLTHVRRAGIDWRARSGGGRPSRERRRTWRTRKGTWWRSFTSTKKQPREQRGVRR